MGFFNRRRRAWILVALSLSVCNSACRQQNGPGAQPEPVPAAGEPLTYSAIVEQTIEDADGRRVVLSRIARSEDKRRDEWAEAGHRWALISRYDLGKSFLLDLDKRLYIETPLTPAEAAPRPPQTETDPQPVT